MKSKKQTKWLRIIVLFFIPIIFSSCLLNNPAQITTNMPKLLTDPFLQLPTADSVNVVWFTEFKGDLHWASVGHKLDQKFIATTTKLGRVREDENSNLEPKPEQLQSRDIWRHEAIVTGLAEGVKLPYQVSSKKAEETVNLSLIHI